MLRGTLRLPTTRPKYGVSTHNQNLSHSSWYAGITRKYVSLCIGITEYRRYKEQVGKLSSSKVV